MRNDIQREYNIIIFLTAWQYGTKFQTSHYYRIQNSARVALKEGNSFLYLKIRWSSHHLTNVNKDTIMNSLQIPFVSQRVGYLMGHEGSSTIPHCCHSQAVERGSSLIN